MSRRMALRRVEDLVNREDDPVKLLAFNRELLPTSCRERVVPCPSIVLRGAPLGLDPAVEQETLQGGVEGTLAYLQHFLGDLLEVLGNAIPVLTAREQGFEESGDPACRAGVQACPFPSINDGSMGITASVKRAVRT